MADEVEEKKQTPSDAEDIPSDFFDDFAKDEFMDGLSVIDSWDDEGGLRNRESRYNAELRGVDDLRQLLRDGREEDRHRRRRNSPRHRGNEREYRDRERTERRRSGEDHRSRLDDYIKPGSRRDPSKTNAAIRKDKEVKVKEYLAKHIEQDIRPPGTELDDYFDGSKPLDSKKPIAKEEIAIHQEIRSRSKETRQHASPEMSTGRSRRRSLRRSPRRSPQRRRSPYRSPRRSPYRSHMPYSPLHHSPRHYSPPRRQRNRYMSPMHLTRSYVRYSPRSPNWDRSRSPRWLHERHSSPSIDHKDQPYLLDAQEHFAHPSHYQMGPEPFPPGVPSDYPSAAPSYPYPVNPSYSGVYGQPYDFIPPALPGPVPQPVPAPVMVPDPMQPVMQPVINPPMNPVPAPVMAPPQQPMPSPVTAPIAPQTRTTPYDALAQLVAEGQLSQEDYMKLAPNKGKSATKVHGSNTNASLDTKTRVEVLDRCTIALSKLGALKAPNRLVMNTNLYAQENKSLTPKFCSPLKRQGEVEFHFTKSGSAAGAQHNKQLIQSIVQAVDLSGVLGKLKRKPAKNTREIGVQTTKPFCDACEIREATERYDVGTSVDREQFSMAAQTQVEEAELARSCAVFAPSGAPADPISIAHLTPAQLVSQLAARAKTFKQGPEHPQQFQRRNVPYSYDGRGPPPTSQYQNYNYRY